MYKTGVIVMEFDEITVQQGLVTVITPIVSSYLATLKFKNSSGTIVDTGQPAIYLGYSNEMEPDNPKIHITFNGDTNLNINTYESGLEVITDPTDPGTTIEVPYEKSYLRYLITLTCDSGAKDLVNRGERKSASFILRKIRDSFNLQSFKTSVHTEMQSSLQTISTITPVYDLNQTNFHDAANMRLTFDTTSTVYDLGGSYIQTINYESTYKRCIEGDDSPIVNTGSVTSV
jgi:hypothetical protein